MQQKTIIKVDHSVRKELMKVLNTTYPTIRKALAGYEGNALAKKIRHVAITQYGGTIYKPIK